MNRPVVGGLILILGLSFSLMGCRRPSRSEEPRRHAFRSASSSDSLRRVRPVLVRVAPATRRPIDIRLSATATLFSEKDVVVYPEISGQVVEIRVNVGDWVHKGELLVRLDDEALTVQFQKARVQKEQLEQELTRQRRLFEANLIARETLEATENRYRQAVFDFEQARINLERTRILAPIEGQVVERFVTEGQFVTSATRLLRIVHTRELHGQVFLPERELTRVRTGQTVIVETDLFPGETFQAVVDQISPIIDVESGTFRVRFRIQRGTDRLRPGMFVRAHIVVARKDAALVVRKSAVVREGERTYVYVVEGGRAFRREVRIGYDGPDFVEVLEGLRPGDSVVVAGQIGLRNGQRVRVMAS